MHVVSFRQKRHVKKEISPYAVLLSANPKEYEPAPLESIKKCFLILLFILRYKVISLSSVSVNHHLIEFVARAETQDPKVWPQPCISTLSRFLQFPTVHVTYTMTPVRSHDNRPFLLLICRLYVKKDCFILLAGFLAAREEEWNSVWDNPCRVRTVLCCCTSGINHRSYHPVIHARETLATMRVPRGSSSTDGSGEQNDVTWATQTEMQIVETGSWPRNYVILMLLVSLFREVNQSQNK